MDAVKLNVVDQWATEIRQKAFNAQFYNAIGEKELSASYAKFANTALGRAEQVLQYQNPNLGKWQSTIIK